MDPLECSCSCGICFEIYDDFRLPLSLPCRHTFCSPCIRELMTKAGEQGFSCPSCQRPVDHTAQLPYNHAALAASDALKGIRRRVSTRSASLSSTGSVYDGSAPPSPHKIPNSPSVSRTSSFQDEARHLAEFHPIPRRGLNDHALLTALDRATPSYPLREPISPDWKSAGLLSMDVPLESKGTVAQSRIVCGHCRGGLSAQNSLDERGHGYFRVKCVSCWRPNIVEKSPRGWDACYCSYCHLLMRKGKQSRATCSYCAVGEAIPIL